MSHVNDFILGDKPLCGGWHLIGLEDGEAKHYDGCHTDIEGVSEAIYLRNGIFGKECYKNVKWIAIYVTDEIPINDGKKSNQEAITSCAKMVKNYG